MSSILSSHAVVFTTAMVASSAMLFVALSKSLYTDHHKHPSKQTLRSCLYSDEKKKLKKKKRVKFAKNVKEPRGNGEEYRRQHTKSLLAGDMKLTSTQVGRNCNTDTQGIPANHVALYSGILRDRVQRTQCSY